MDVSIWVILIAFSAFTLCTGHRHAPEHQWQNVIDVNEHACNKYHHGCTVQENMCQCDTVMACKDPWPYRSMEECHDDQKGSLDVCKHHPSCGRGFCVQTKHENVRKAKCECAGSGHFGSYCEYKCPQTLGRLDPDFPEACLLS